jgi:hypothetical protein
VWWQRLVALILLVAAMMLVFSFVGWALDLSTGYGSAQSRSAVWLADHPSELAGWRASATRDLLLYIPIYLIAGIAAFVVATRHPWPSITLLALGALADVAETVRFRGTLDDLIAGRTATELAERASSTAFLTGAKWAFILASVVTLCYAVLGRRA